MTPQSLAPRPPQSVLQPKTLPHPTTPAAYSPRSTGPPTHRWFHDHEEFDTDFDIKVFAIIEMSEPPGTVAGWVSTFPE
jgi:hypothetical protein